MLAPLLPLLLFTSPILSLSFPNSAHSEPPAADPKPAYFVLAGDSTTAKQSDGGGGWGNGFLATLQAPAAGVNLGHNGATTVSFKTIAKPNWEQVLEEVKAHRGRAEVWVTIQFGHNDQKEDKHISVRDFQRNLENLAKEVKSAGATPILVTPLTRRSFSGTKVPDSLGPQREATIAAAKSSNLVYIDLNAESQRYVNAIGEQAARKYNLKDKDNTHLNEHGSKVFGRMVADLIVERVPEVGRWVKKDEGLSLAIKSGKAA